MCRDECAAHSRGSHAEPTIAPKSAPLCESAAETGAACALLGERRPRHRRRSPAIDARSDDRDEGARNTVFMATHDVDEAVLLSDGERGVLTIDAKFLHYI